MTRFVPVPDVLVSHLEGEAVLLHMGTKEYFRLNRTGAHIWKTLEGGADVETVVRGLVETFDVTPAEAEAAVRQLFTELRENRLIREG